MPEAERNRGPYARTSGVELVIDQGSTHDAGFAICSRTTRCPGWRPDKDTREKRYRYAETGLPDVVIENVVMVACEPCGETYTSVPAIEELHRQIAAVLRSGAVATRGVFAIVLRLRAPLFDAVATCGLLSPLPLRPAS